MSDSVAEIIRSVVGELKEIARCESVVGQAITIGDKTVVPVVRLSVGFGVGAGDGDRQKTGGSLKGGGGAGGASITPVAFIIMNKDEISLLPVNKSSWEGLVESIPGVAKKIAELTKDFKSVREADKDGDPDAQES